MRTQTLRALVSLALYLFALGFLMYVLDDVIRTQTLGTANALSILGIIISVLIAFNTSPSSASNSSAGRITIRLLSPYLSLPKVLQPIAIVVITIILALIVFLGGRLVPGSGVRGGLQGVVLPCQNYSFSNQEVIFRAVDAEAAAVRNGDLAAVESLFAPDALIIDAGYYEGGPWKGARSRYEPLLARLHFTDVQHFGTTLVGQDATTIYAVSGSSGVYRDKTTNSEQSYLNQPPSDHWTFRKNQAGCWVISSFAFNARDARPFPP